MKELELVWKIDFSFIPRRLLQTFDLKLRKLNQALKFMFYEPSIVPRLPRIVFQSIFPPIVEESFTALSCLLDNSQAVSGKMAKTEMTKKNVKEQNDNVSHDNGMNGSKM